MSGAEAQKPLFIEHFGQMSQFTRFVAFWPDVAIYTLCRILLKCRDLRIFPGKNIGSQAPKTAPLLAELINPTIV